MRVTYMTSVNHALAPIATTILHAYSSAANPRKPAQTLAFAQKPPGSSALGGLIHSWCKPWGNGEANLLKLLEIWMFSVASVIMLDGAARLERFVSRSLRVTACRRRHFAPRVNQTPFKCSATPEFRAGGADPFEDREKIF